MCAPTRHAALIIGSLRGTVETETRVHKSNSNQMFLHTTSRLPDMVAHVFILQAFAPLFCLKAVIYKHVVQANTDRLYKVSVF